MSSHSLHRFVVLDGLRGVAAICVLLFHLAQQHDRMALPFAEYAVDFFYILSGFVVAFAYESRLQAKTMTWPAFAWVRIRRLYPLVCLGTVLGIGLGLMDVLQHHISLHDVAVAGALGLALLPSYVFPQWQTAYPFNMASWSLTFELAVNAAYAAMAPILTQRRLLAMVAIGMALLCWLVWKRGTISGGNNQDNVAYGFARVVFPFFCGVALYRFRLPQRKAPRLAAFLLAGLALLFLLPMKGAAISLIGVLVIFPGIVALGAASEVESGLRRLCRWGGELSYPLYILQAPLLQIGGQILRRLHLSGAMFGLFGAAEFVIVCGFAYAAVTLFDEPVQIMLRRRRGQSLAVHQ